MSKITKELLKTWNPCVDGYRRFIELFPEGATLQEAIDGLVTDGHDDWAWWLFSACQRAGVCLETTSRGYGNSGYRNSGNGNSGDWNSGNGNSGDRNSGNFNRDVPPTIRVFEQECPRQQWRDAYKPNFLYFDTVEWVSSSAMTEAEKTRFPGHAGAGGILRTLSYKEAFKRSWDRADHEDRIRVTELPNFDAQIFYNISGIDLREGHGE